MNSPQINYELVELNVKAKPYAEKNQIRWSFPTPAKQTIDKNAFDYMVNVMNFDPGVVGQYYYVIA